MEAIYFYFTDAYIYFFLHFLYVDTCFPLPPMELKKCNKNQHKIITSLSSLKQKPLVLVDLLWWLEPLYVVKRNNLTEKIAHLD